MAEGKNQFVRKFTLQSTSFPVSASLWFYISEINAWRLIIGTPGVRANGPKEAYEKIQSVVASIPDTQAKISLKDITVVDTDSDPLISLLRTLFQLPGVNGIRFSDNVINGVLIEDAYLYRIT